MISGEAGSELTPFDPYDWQIRQSDGVGEDATPTSSRYSSYGESEFERYCSANSAINTPSVCSAISVFNDCASEFCSLKSYGTGDDNVLENFTLAGKPEMSRDNHRLLGLSESIRDRKIGISKDYQDNWQSSMKYGSSGFELYGNDDGELEMLGEEISGRSSNEIESFGVKSALMGNNICGIDQGERSVAHREASLVKTVKDSVQNVSVGDYRDVTTLNGFLGNGNGNESNSELGSTIKGDCSSHLPSTEGDLEGSNTHSTSQFGEGYVEEEEGNLSDHHHSESEDSMCNYGTDVDNKNQLGVPKLPMITYSLQERKANNENRLLMNSSVAFGSEDWDDFALKSQGSAHIFQNLDELAPISVRRLNPANDASEIVNKEIEVAAKNMNFVLRNVVDASELATDTKSSSLMPLGFGTLDQTGDIKDVKDSLTTYHLVEGSDELTLPTKVSSHPETEVSNIGYLHPEESWEIDVHKNREQGVDMLVNCPSSSNSQTAVSHAVNLQLEDAREIDVIKSHELDAEMFLSCPRTSYANNCKLNRDQPGEEALLKIGLNIMMKDKMIGREQNYRKVFDDSDNQYEENQNFAHLEEKLDIQFDGILHQSGSISIVSPSHIVREHVEDDKANLLQSKFGMKKTSKSLPAHAHLFEETPVTSKEENFERNEFYDEVVNEMEEILLDSVDSPGARFSVGDRTMHTDLSIPLREGGLTASSGSSYEYPQGQKPVRIDGIEVIGARQKRGNVSFSERLAGVKEYTVYKIRVVSGKDQWEVERRYREFLTLYRRVKAHFADKGWDLPFAWSSVEQRSGKIFGSASPDIVAVRSVLIQECLQSILHARVYSSLPSALHWFLSPRYSCPSSPTSSTALDKLVLHGNGATNMRFLSSGTTISLYVEIQHHKSIKQMLEAQHYTCAGCRKHFDDGNTLIWDFVQSFGWGKPRRCEYTGQLFCSSCHSNDSAVLPARVLHHWDFSQYPVSQLAKFYLDSIHDKPMLCVSAVNPFLFSKVPTLLHVMGLRRKIGDMLPYVGCPFRGLINRGLGSRRYLLESNDFFALRDLIDLSKGPFAALPVILETVSRKILQHITEQCLICCDIGIACGARQDCSDPSSLIFPFQEGEVEKCVSCGKVFHKSCYRKLGTCPCKSHLGSNEKMDYEIVSRHEGGETGANLELGKGFGSRLTRKFLSGLLLKQKPETYGEHKHNENTILMGSLPSTSL